MTPCEVDYALQTLMSKIKERELESQRALNEYDVTNRLLKRQLQELQEKLNEKEYQLSDAHETIRALRGVTQVITGLQDEIRALRTELLTSQSSQSHPPIMTPSENPPTCSRPIRAQVSDDLSSHTLTHRSEADPTYSDYISQNSTSEPTTLLNVISDCGRTTEIAVPSIKEEEQKVEMDGGADGEEWGEEGESEGQAPVEMVKTENESEWVGSFEYNMAAHSCEDPPNSGFSDTYSNHQMTVLEMTTTSTSHCSSVAVVTTNPRKRPLTNTQLDSHSASVMVQRALRAKLGGDRIIQEYNKMKCLSDRSRRKMVNILVADMMENQGRHPPASVRESYALGIVTLFPLLKDLNSKNGYEHYFDPNSGSGYLAWRLKTVQRNSSSRVRRSLSSYRKTPTSLPANRKGPPASLPTYQDGPRIHRAVHSAPPPISPFECQEAMNLMRRSMDTAVIKENMRATFRYRQEMVHNPATTMTTTTVTAMSSVVNSVLEVFPRFLDTPGLISQDFAMLFGEEVSARFLSQWRTFYKPRIIADGKRLPHGSHMDRLLASLNQPSDSSDDWDSDLATILLLLHLLPPTSQGKRHKKISASEAGDHLVKFLRTGQSLEGFLEETQSRTPFLLCIGERKSSIQRYFVVIEQKAIPCEANTAIGAFDELFKAHFVLGRSYDEPLCSFFTFLQTTVYGIDVGSARESPRVREIRARLLNNSQ
ncbi:hypothetical protein ACEWY4_017472 [Coilia grayii]|uniref:Uncharacterized protein n=1 Tax=Coilia grayii TaxID=363190 RepID=A0ABD1JGY5_9TELE